MNPASSENPSEANHLDPANFGDVIVLKFGGSILRDLDSVREVAHEVYREVRKGRRVVCVCSAFHGHTDTLIHDATSFVASPEKRAFASLVAMGEMNSSAHVALALEEAGIPATLLDPAQIKLLTEGCHLDAEPVSVDADVIHRELGRGRVVVVPGYAGRDEDGFTTLLGRGGSDYTALFLAKELGSGCRLIKDVDGWYDRDPAKPGAKRYARLSFADAIENDAPVVQHKCVEYAAEHGFFFEVAAMGSDGGTLVGPDPSLLAPTDNCEDCDLRPVRVVMLGLGTVGGGVLEHVRRDKRISVEKILVRDIAKHAAAVGDDALLTDDPDEALATPCDVVLELIGGVDLAGELVEKALAAGRHVVTANKALLAARGIELESLARTNGVRVLGSASVGGAVPMLELVQRLADRGTPIESIAGVINGTCNFVLDRIAAGIGYAEAVAEAQRAGFAEADPSADVGGHDAAAKICLLARVAFDPETRVDAVDVSGIDVLGEPGAEAPKNGRLVARASKDGSLKVALEAVPEGDPLGSVRAESNVLVATLGDGSREFVVGKGAGRRPTAEAVFADLRDLLPAIRGVGCDCHSSRRSAV